MADKINIKGVVKTAPCVKSNNVNSGYKTREKIKVTINKNRGIKK